MPIKKRKKHVIRGREVWIANTEISRAIPTDMAGAYETSYRVFETQKEAALYLKKLKEKIAFTHTEVQRGTQRDLRRQRAPTRSGRKAPGRGYNTKLQRLEYGAFLSDRAKDMQEKGIKCAACGKKILGPPYLQLGRQYYHAAHRPIGAYR